MRVSRETAFCMSLLAVLVTAPALAAAAPPPPTSAGLRMTAGVRIDSDAQLLASGLGSGAGMQASPYVINGLVINAMGGTEGLYLGNISLHVRLTNASFFGATTVSLPYFGGALVLFNASHVSVYDSSFTTSGNGVLSTSSSNSTFVNVSSKSNDFEGFYLINSHDNVILASNASSNLDAGVWISSSHRTRIVNSSFAGNAYGIYADPTTGNLITRNRIINNPSEGIQTIDMDDSEISWNYITKASIDSGIWLSTSSERNLVHNNTIIDCIYGIAIWGGGVERNMVDDNTIRGGTYALGFSQARFNEVRRNTVSMAQYGAYFSAGSSGNNLTRNNLTGNVNGIWIEASPGNLVAYNRVWNSDSLGVNIRPPLGSSAVNFIHHNDFQGNNASGGPVQALDESGGSTWNDSMEGNHWADFDEIGEGCNPTGNVCASPYFIPGGTGARDHKPLTTAPVPQLSGALIAVLGLVAGLAVTFVRGRRSNARRKG